MSKARKAGLLVVVVALALVITRGGRLLPSDESDNITELDGEGMTMDTAGDLYVVSQPNQPYRFSKTKNAQVAAAE